MSRTYEQGWDDAIRAAGQYVTANRSAGVAEGLLQALIDQAPPETPRRKLRWSMYDCVVTCRRVYEIKGGDDGDQFFLCATEECGKVICDRSWLTAEQCRLVNAWLGVQPLNASGWIDLCAKLEALP